MIIFGKRLFGKTDAVPGLFYVQTNFFHIDFIPLYPFGSFLVLDTLNERRFIMIPLHKKSFFLAYLRSLSILGILVCLYFGISALQYPNSTLNAAIYFVSCVFFCGVAAYSWCSKNCKIANYECATELCSYFGNDCPKYQHIVDKILGEANTMVKEKEGAEPLLQAEYDGMELSKNLV